MIKYAHKFQMNCQILLDHLIPSAKRGRDKKAQRVLMIPVPHCFQMVMKPVVLLTEPSTQTLKC